MNKLKIALAAIAAMFAGPAQAQDGIPDSLSRKPTHYVGLDIRPGYVFPTHSFSRATTPLAKP